MVVRGSIVGQREEGGMTTDEKSNWGEGRITILPLP
jgi:hypothetical protein